MTLAFVRLTGEPERGLHNRAIERARDCPDSCHPDTPIVNSNRDFEPKYRILLQGGVSNELLKHRNVLSAYAVVEADKLLILVEP